MFTSKNEPNWLNRAHLDSKGLNENNLHIKRLNDIRRDSLGPQIKYIFDIWSETGAQYLSVLIYPDITLTNVIGLVLDFSTPIF